MPNMRPEATFIVRQNVTLPVESAIFLYNKTRFIPESDSPQKSPKFYEELYLP